MPFETSPLYFENATGQVRENPAGYVVVSYSAGKRTIAEFNTLLTKAGQLLLARKWQRMLSDQRLMATFTEEEKVWSAEHWLGQRIARPTQLWVAMLVPLDVFARLSIAQVLSQATPGTVNYQPFTQEQAAHDYLIKLSAQ
jgi:hypothetical protein